MEEEHLESTDAMQDVTAAAVVQSSSGVVPLMYMKAYYFASFCFFATHYRYLTLYFESDGLTPSQIGLLWSVYRVISTVCTPFWSALADKTKRARTLVQCSLLAGILPFFGLAIPCGTNALVPRAAAFWLFAFAMSGQAALRDALAIAACGQDSDLWGQARVYGAVGWGFMHLVLGPMLDAGGFSILFISFSLLAFMLFVVTRVSVPEACGQVSKEVTTRAVLDIFSRNWIFFFNVAAIGAGFSMVEGMLFLLLDELQAPSWLCGLSVVVTVLFELPIFHYAKLLLDRIGTKNMILLGQVAWVARALFYANMTVAWTVLLIEPLHGVTFALVWTAATQHVAKPSVSGEGFEASAQGLLTATFMGIGPVLGLAIGGQLFEHVGSHAVYAVFSVVILLVGILYAWKGDQGIVSYGGVDTCTKTETVGKPTLSRSMSLNEGDSILDDVCLTSTKFDNSNADEECGKALSEDVLDDPD